MTVTLYHLGVSASVCVCVCGGGGGGLYISIAGVRMITIHSYESKARKAY